MIKKVWLKGFRNLKECVFELKNKTPYFIYGANNQGKTNFLEGLFFLGNGYSPVTNHLSNLIQFDLPEAVLGADFDYQNQTQRLYWKLTRDSKKQAILNQKVVRSYVQLDRYFHVAYLSADVIRIFTDNPEQRRLALNRFCVKFEPEYARKLNRYEQLLKQKNHALKSGKHLSLNVWNDQIVALAAEIVQVRIKSLRVLQVALFGLARDVPHFSIESLDIHYLTHGAGEAPYLAEEYRGWLQEKMTQFQDKEQLIGYSLFGPHRDDFVITINGRSLFLFFSRGINRIMAILFKLAEMSALKQTQNHDQTILLLDDVFVELDEEMKRFLIPLVCNHAQVFYTTVLPQEQNLFDHAQFIRVETGAII